MKTIPFNSEQAKAGRLVICDGNLVRFMAIDNRHALCQFGIDCYRTIPASNLSHPAEPAPGHNPAGLDEWQVGTRDGWRLLEKEELLTSRTDAEGIERWNGVEWLPHYNGNDKDKTYRTKRLPGYFLPGPKTRVIRLEEFPDSFILMETGSNVRVPWVSFRENFEDPVAIANAIRAGWKWSRSLDGPWRPFTVEETL